MGAGYGVLHGLRLAQRKRGWLLAKRGLAAPGAGNHVIAMRVGGADDDDGVDRGVVDESEGIGIPLGHVEFARGVLGELGIGVGDSGEAHTGQARRQVARVDFSQPSNPDQACVKLGHYLPRI